MARVHRLLQNADRLTTKETAIVTTTTTTKAVGTMEAIAAPKP